MTRRSERGIGTLATCVVLLGVLALAAAWAARQMATAQRVAANDLRAAAAFEAAEAGLAWTVAMLNGGTIDDACRPAHATAATGAAGAAVQSGSPAADFRARFLSIDGEGRYRARAGAGVGPDTLRPPGCSNTAPLRWTCRCDAAGGGASSAGGTAAGGTGGTARDIAMASAPTRPRFEVRFADAGAPGQLRLLVQGCSDARADCDDLSEGPSGVAESAQQLALLSALRMPPASARIEGPGSFQRVFGMPAGRYRGQPAVARLRCGGDCAGPMAQALARGRRLLWIDGDARLSRWPDQALNGAPLVLIVDGRLDASAPGHPQGLVYARDGVTWHPPAGSAASLRGAVVTDGVIDHARSVALIHDPAILDRIHRQMGSFLPVPGGWTPTR